MQEINLNINSKNVKGREGDTVLEVCKRNDIYIPTLCHMDGLSNNPSCRMCIVEIEGERRVTPSCTYPARDGLVVKTHTEKLEKYRRQILELLFTERNHFCMFCEKSGDCELQSLAYLYQMQNVRYSYLSPQLPVDALSQFLAIDHSRCILCGRCVRACNEVAAGYTLDFGGRGGKTSIVADVNQQLNESSCTQCGACLQSCPTGAIMSKVSMYKGKTESCQQLSTVCPGCGIGCEINVFVKDNNIVRIKSPVISSPRGALCKIGRFDILRHEGIRVTSPSIRNKDGILEVCTLEKAISVVAQKMHELKNDFGGMISTQCTNESMAAFRQLFDKSGSNLIDTLDGKTYRILSEGLERRKQEAAFDLPLEYILQADCILAIGGDIETTHPVVGTLIRRAVKQSKAKLIVIDPIQNQFKFWSDFWLNPYSGTEDTLIIGLTRILAGDSLIRDINKLSGITGISTDQLLTASQVCKNARCIVIICGNSLLSQNSAIAETVVNAVKQCGTEGKMGMIILKPAINSYGAWATGTAKQDVRSANPKGLYLVMSDDKLNGEMPRWLKITDFLAVQASYVSPITEMADVILPSPVWAERAGSYTTMDGRNVLTKRVLQPVNGILQDEDILKRITNVIANYTDNVNFNIRR
jgi:formate dehydrogenase major subunit